MATYSAKAVSEGHGTSYWNTPSGGKVEVSGVGHSPADYSWPDAVNLGEVVSWAHAGKTASSVKGARTDASGSMD